MSSRDCTGEQDSPDSFIIEVYLEKQVDGITAD